MVSTIKITLGMIAFYTNFMFINRLCLVFEPNQCPAELDMSLPNALVAFSLLVSLGNCNFMQIVFRIHAMPLWVANVMDALVTMYLTELIIRQFWIPLLAMAHLMCEQLAMYLHELSSGGMVSSFNPITVWLKHDAMFAIQIAIAFVFVYIMLHVTGFLEWVKRTYFNWFGRAHGDVDYEWKHGNADECFGLPPNCPIIPSILKKREPVERYVTTSHKLKRQPSLRSVSFKS